jgi:hypothetical protein
MGNNDLVKLNYSTVLKQTTKALYKEKKEDSSIGVLTIRRNLFNIFNNNLNCSRLSIDSEAKPVELLTDRTHKTSVNKYMETVLNECDNSNVIDADFIFKMMSREADYASDPNYLNRHPDLKQEFRAILLDWIMELCEEFGFKRDTFYYCVNHIDRYLSRVEDVTKANLQLVGAACLSIAAKFEEIQIPRIQEYIVATDSVYDMKELVGMEKHILKVKDIYIDIKMGNYSSHYLYLAELVYYPMGSIS